MIGRGKEENEYPATRVNRRTAEHPANPCADIVREVGCIDDCRHDEDNHRPYLDKADVLAELSEDAKARGAHVEAVHERSEDEEQEVRRIVLRLPVKTRGDACICQKEEAEEDKPRAHADNLHAHRGADDARVAAARLLAHIALVRRLVAEHDRTEAVHDEVDKEEMRDAQRLDDAKERSNGTHNHRRNVDDELEAAELQNVVVDRAPVENRVLDRAEIVVEDDDISCIPRCLRPAAHRKADIGAAQGGRVVHPIARHANHEVHLLREAHDARLVRRQCACNDAQLRQDTLYLLIPHLGEVAARQNKVAIRTQQSRVAGNCNGGLAAVSRHHNDLHARRLYLRDCLTRLGTHIVTDRSKSDENDIRIDCILLKGLLRIPERQDAHRTRGIGVYFFVQRICIKGNDRPIRRKRVFRPCQQCLGSPLVDDRAACGQLRLTEFIGGVKCLAMPHAIVFIDLHRTVCFCTEEAHDRLIGRISADHRARLVIHGGGVHADREFQLFVEHRMLRERAENPAIRRKEVHHLKLSTRDRARLVTEENVQRARRLNANRAAHENTACEHPARVLHQHERNHERQPLGHGADDDEDRKRDCLNQIHENLTPPEHDICLQPTRTQGKEHHVE